jgi:putative ABC transport system permease protein
VAVSGQLAHLASLGPGDTVTLLAPAGERKLPVLGVFTDFRVGYLGGFALSRDLYREGWGDSLVTSIRVWLDRDASVAAVRRTVQDRFGASHGIHAVTADDFRGAVADLTESIFALHYTIVLIALLVSVVGVANFLITAALDRRPEFRTLAAVGVPPSHIARAIVAEGALLGVLGSAIGLGAGVFVSRLIVRHSVPMVNGWLFDFRFPLPTALRLCAGAVVLTAAAGLLPARLATRRQALTEELAE